MKKILLALMLILSINVWGQNKIISESATKISYSQKHGLDVYNDDYKLTVIYDSKKLSFNTRDNQKMEEYLITKSTPKFIIGKNTSGNYCFFDINRKTIIYIDYFMSRYIISAIGSGYSENKQIIIKMMSLINEGKTQKDIIQHLINQIEMDF